MYLIISIVCAHVHTLLDVCISCAHCVCWHAHGSHREKWLNLLWKHLAIKVNETWTSRNNYWEDQLSSKCTTASTIVHFLWIQVSYNNHTKASTIVMYIKFLPSNFSPIQIWYFPPSLRLKMVRHFIMWHYVHTNAWLEELILRRKLYYLSCVVIIW